MIRSRLSTVLALVLPTFVLSTALSAQTNVDAYPSKPIRLINPLGAGGTAEALARTIAQGLAAGLGQHVVVETRAGATGTIGADHVAKSAPDGYTLLYGVSGTMVIAPALYKKLPFDPERDLEPVSVAFSGPSVLVVQTSLGINSLQELIAAAKSKPGALSYASAGPGSMSHLNTEILKDAAGLDLVHVPYKGGGAAVPDLLAGRVQLMIETNTGVLPLVRSGKLKPLAVTTAQRVAQFPDLPTFTGLGFPQVTSAAWGGVFAPTATPRAIIDRLADEMAKMARTPSYRDHVASLNNVAVSSSPAEFRTLVRDEMKRYAEVIRRVGVKID